MSDAAAIDPDWTIARGLRQVQSLNPAPDAGYTFVRQDGSERKLPFPELEAEAWRRGRHLLGLGLRKGDRLGFIVPDPEDFVLTFLGATCVGIVPVPLYPPLGLGKLDAYLASSARILTRSGCRMLMTGRKVQPLLWSLVDRVPSLEEIVPCEALAGRAPSVGGMPAVRPDDVAFLQYTSGSTSDPKGVVVTHRSLGANGWAIMRHGLDVRIETDRCLSWLPLYHDMGLIGFVISPLTAGLQAILMPTMGFIKRPATWMEAMSRYEATITFAPNFAYGLAVKRTKPEQLAAMDLSHVRVLGAGAEPNHPATLEAFLEHFGQAGLPREAMMPVYGMAEATLAMSFTHHAAPHRTDRVDGARYQQLAEATPAGEGAGDGGVLEFVSCGQAFPDHEIVVIDAEGNELPERCVGELVFRGPSVAAGYYQADEATRRAFTPQGLRTGDLGYIAGGEVYVTGRAKDLIILNGKNYDPQSIEWLAAEVPGIRQGNVVAFSRPGEGGEELVVVAEIRKDQALDGLVDAVRRKIQQELFLSPADVRLLGPGTLPKTTSGKLQRARARQQYLDGTLGAEGVRTLGDRGQVLTVAKHVAASTVSRVRHRVRRMMSR